MDFIQGTPRTQISLFPEAIDDYIAEENPVRFIDVFVDGLDLVEAGLNERSLELQVVLHLIRVFC